MHESAPPFLPPQGNVGRYFAFVRLVTPSDDLRYELWLGTCYRLTPRLEQLERHAALLDLGPCTDEEAMAVLQAFAAQLREQKIVIQAGVAPSGILAQLAIMQVPMREPFALVTHGTVIDMLRALPVSVLPRLRLPGAIAITSQIVAWLERSGVRTLAHLAQLDEDHLRRQFGARVGAILVTLARGEDHFPLQPTAPSPRLRFRLHLSSPVAPDRLVDSLDPFTCAVAATLARRGLHGHTLELRVLWEDGAPQRVIHTLPHPIADERALSAAIRRLLDPYVRAEQAVGHRGHGGQVKGFEHGRAIADLRLILSHLSRRAPDQHAIWEMPTKKRAVAQAIAGVLARRHGKPVLFHSVLSAPDAIFERDRSQLTPVASLSPAASLAPLDADVGASSDLSRRSRRGRSPAHASADALVDATDAADVATMDDTGEDPWHSVRWG